MRKLVALALAALAFAAPAPAAEPQPFLRGSWQALREAHARRPAIVHFWGLTCGPCLAELPDWGRFVREQHGAATVMVAADPVAVAPADLAATLDKAGLGRVESWRFADPFAERLEYEIDPQWHGELPLTLLIGRSGAVTRILGAVDFAQLRRWVARERGGPGG